MAKKIVTVTLDKERHMKFDLNALILAEKMTGKKMAEFGNEEGGIELDVIRALVYAGLKWEDKELTVETVGENIDLENLGEIADKLGEALGGLK